MITERRRSCLPSERVHDIPRTINNTMGLFTVVKSFPLVAVSVAGAAVYPAMPIELTTPVQQRLAINGPNSTVQPRAPDIYDSIC